MIQIPAFANKSDLFGWLVANKSLLIAQKTSAIKNADAVIQSIDFLNEREDDVIKSDEVVPVQATKLFVRSVVNTTKLFDSHLDVHIDQLWNKSLKETKQNYLVQEHNFGFAGIISRNVKAFAKQMTWASLNYNYEGSTQALVYDSILTRKASWPLGVDMFELYRTKEVNQHSVGMRYVKMDFAVNDERYEKEFAVWNKYFEVIANKEAVIDNGYFWPVTEAKNIEGSAVVRGANFATPTVSIQEVKSEPGAPTRKKTEPVKSTLKASDLMEFYKPSKHI